MNIKFKTPDRLGDSLWDAHYIRKCAQKYPNYIFDFFIVDKHYNSICEFITDVPNVNVSKHSYAPNNCYTGWIGQFGIPKLPAPLDEWKLESYNKLSKLIGIESPFNNAEDLLFDNKELLTTYKENETFDVLMINSEPLSNQIKYVESDYVDFAYKVINSGKTIITTKKIEGIPSVWDTGFNLTPMGIGSLSLKCKVIVGIGTGPIHPCLNVWNKNKRFLYIDHPIYYKHLKNIVMINNMKEINI